MKLVYKVIEIGITNRNRLHKLTQKLNGIRVNYLIFLFAVWRQSQEKKKNAAKKNAEEKTDSSNSVGKSKSETSNKDTTKAPSSTKGDIEMVDGSNEENKENEDDDSDEIQEIPA